MGIGAAIGSAVAAIGSAFGAAGASVAGAIGLADATLGGITAGSLIGGGLESAAIGAGLGGIEGAVTHGNILEDMGIGALGGAVTGGFGPAIGGLTGLGTVGGDVIAGAGAGALGSGITGGNPLTGALEGGAAGGIGGMISGAGGGTGTGAGMSAASATPDFSGIGGSATSGLDLTGLSTGAPAPDLIGAAPSGLSLGTSTATGDLGGAPTGTQPVGALTQDPSAVASFLNGSGAPSTPAVDVGGSGSGGPVFGNNTMNSLFGNGASPSDLLGTNGTYITPPIPPALDASGDPILDEYGNPTYADQATYNAAQAQGSGIAPAAAPTAANPAAIGPQLGSSGGVLGTGMTGMQAGALGIGGAGLLYNMMQKNSVPGEKALTTEANTLGSEATQLQNYVATGTLPPGVNTVLQQVQQGMTQQIKARYAALGMSGSTAEQQDLNNATLQVQSQGATEALNLMNQGVSMANLSSNLLQSLMSTNVQQNNQTVQSIGQLAAALAGGGTTTLKVATG